MTKLATSVCMMLRLLVAMAICEFVVPVAAAEKIALAGTRSPDHRIVNVQEGSVEGEHNYYFVAGADGRNLGDVLPPAQRLGLREVEIVSSWNRNGSRVASLLFYSTKHSELLLFEKGINGRIQAIKWHPPDPASFYRREEGKSLPINSQDADYNAVGPWVDENTIALVSGFSFRFREPADFACLFVTYKARLSRRQVIVSDGKLYGPLTEDQAAQAFIRRWGERYFSGSEKTNVN